VVANKVIVVTGAGSGIGRATAKVLAEGGAQVVAADVSMPGAEETAAQIADAGGQAVAFRADVANEADVAAMVSFAERRFGRLDGAVNNAGVMAHSKRTDVLSAAEWRRVIDIDLNGVFYCMRHEIELMARQGGGAIVNISSVCGMVGLPSSVEYVAAKHGVVGATRAAACEAGATKVRVNAVLPGSIRTPMVAGALEAPAFRAEYDALLARHVIGRIGEPEDVAYAVRWLLSDEASFVNGAAIPVDGGYTAR
jgi:NAD(P)-dependent dehydrogenase (short-subunit alcohol dehydrogenase family)